MIDPTTIRIYEDVDFYRAIYQDGNLVFEGDSWQGQQFLHTLLGVTYIDTEETCQTFCDTDGNAFQTVGDIENTREDLLKEKKELLKRIAELEVELREAQELAR